MPITTLYARVLQSLAGRPRTIAAIIAGNLAVAAVQFIDPLLFGRVIGGLFHGNQESSSTGLIAAWAAIGAAGIALSIATNIAAERLAHRTRLAAIQRAFTHVLTLPPSFHAANHSGRVLKSTLAGSDAIFSLALSFFKENLATGVAVFVLLPASALLNWRLSLVLLALVAIFTGATLLVVRRTQSGQRRAEAAHSALATRAQDAIANVTAVQSFGRLQAEAQEFARIIEQVVCHQFPVLNWWALASILTRASATLGVIAIVTAGTILHRENLATVSQIVTFMGFATLLIGRLQAGIDFTSGLFLRAPVLADYFALCDAATTVPERADAEPLSVPQGEVAFENVAFAYPGGPAILADLGFVARPGTITALVGSTGAGKSTAMNLLTRAWDPTSGGILIDGQDIRDVTLESLRASIGVVFQESLLFNRTIRENLLVGKPDATQAELEEACRLAEAHDFIERQPRGYDTLVGERGATLSGGQRQRLAIARALLKNAPILVLDEATSALDAATEQRVTRAMQRLMAGRTTFVIAHRLSTVRDADEILVFDRGRVVERGRFETLVRAGGRFAELVGSQLAAA